MTPNSSALCAAVSALLIAAAVPAQAQTAASAPMASAPAAGSRALDSSDRKFVEKAAMGGMAEVELGKLAQQRGADPQVKAFGERMVQDHTKANDELMRIVSAKGVAAPTMDKSHHKDAEKLAKKSGGDFDKAYMKHMVDDHKKTVKDFEKASKSAKDADVKGFATRTLPTLQEHTKQAQATYDAVRKSR